MAFLPHVRLMHCAVMVAFGSIVCVPPALAQIRVGSFDELRRELAAGDRITVVPAGGRPVEGRLIRLGDADLEVQLADRRSSPERGRRDVTIALTAIQSLDRPRDSARNGAAIGAGIGAGVGGGMFLYALAIDRNEIDEWAPFYVGAAALCTGIGALIGWAADAAHSKPHIRFEAAPKGKTNVSVQPVYRRGRGIALTVSLSR